MPKHRARRATAVDSLRTAASTLLLTGVASAATVLVLSQATSTFTGTWSDRADGTVASGEFPPITVHVAEPHPSVSPTAPQPRKPVTDPTPTPTPIPTPSANPTRTPADVPPINADPAPRPTPPAPPTAQPTPHPTDSHPVSTGGDTTGPRQPPTGPVRTPPVSGGEAGSFGGKSFDNLSQHGRGTAVSFALGEVGHLSLCSGKGVNKHCAMGYDNSSPASPAAVPVVPASPAAPSPTPVTNPVAAPEPASHPVAAYPELKAEPRHSAKHKSHEHPRRHALARHSRRR